MFSDARLAGDAVQMQDQLRESGLSLALLAAASSTALA
jgi:hypothetical protein